MKKLIVILALCLPAMLAAQMTYVPDNRFEQYLINIGLDTEPLNDSVPTENIASQKILNFPFHSIYDLTGIEDFNELEELICYSNPLQKLDLSRNHKLKKLYCYRNDLKYLDVSGCQNLEIINCSENKLTSLDVSKCSSLIELICFKNQISSLLLTNAVNLESINCHYNKLKFIDLNGNSKLLKLTCAFNELTNIQPYENPLLQELYCQNNQIEIVDVSFNPALELLNVQYNNISNLKLYNNPNLLSLSVDENKLVGLNLSKNNKLKSISCAFNNLQFLFLNNGNNKNMLFALTYGNPELQCIEVDDSMFCANNFDWRKDEHAVWSEDCSLINSTEEETNTGNNITLSPNPARDYIEINNVILNEVKDPEILVYNLLSGKLMDSRFSGNDILVSSEGNVRINVSSLSPGVYFVKVGSRVSKFVKI